MLDRSVFEDEVFGFHAQQAVEKALKAWLSYCGVEYPRTHNLVLLIDLLDDAGETISEEFRKLADLTDYAVLLRYETVDSVALIENREEIANGVRALVESVATMLPAS